MSDGTGRLILVNAIGLLMIILEVILFFEPQLIASSNSFFNDKNNQDSKQAESNKDNAFKKDSNNTKSVDKTEDLASSVSPTIVPTATPIPEPTAVSPSPSPSPTPAQVLAISETSLDSLFALYGQEYGVDAALLSSIARCESEYNPNAVNGPYGGMFQFHYTTWITMRTHMGLNSDPELRFNTEESIRTAAFKISRDGAGAWPVCSR